MACTAVFIVFVLFAGAANADASEEAGAFVQDIGDKVIGLIQRTDLAMPARREGFRRIFISNIDLNVVSRAALGRYRKMATEAQFTRFQAIYPDYVLVVYSGLFESYKGETLKVVGSQPVGNGDVLVDGTIERPAAPAIKIGFRIRRRDDGFKVLDVFIEGISMLRTQRSEFAAVIQREGMDGFLERIQKIARKHTSDQ